MRVLLPTVFVTAALVAVEPSELGSYRTTAVDFGSVDSFRSYKVDPIAFDPPFGFYAWVRIDRNAGSGWQYLISQNYQGPGDDKSEFLIEFAEDDRPGSAGNENWHASYDDADGDEVHLTSRTAPGADGVPRLVVVNILDDSGEMYFGRSARLPTLEVVEAADGPLGTAVPQGPLYIGRKKQGLAEDNWRNILREVGYVDRRIRPIEVLQLARPGARPAEIFDQDLRHRWVFSSPQTVVVDLVADNDALRISDDWPEVAGW